MLAVLLCLKEEGKGEEVEQDEEEEDEEGL